MFRFLSIVFVVLVLVPGALAWAAGPHDGEWTGELVAKEGKTENCGFQWTPFSIRVENNRFQATGMDATKRQRTIEGAVGDDGKIDVWINWGHVGTFMGLPEKGKGKLSGVFSSHGFRGTLYSQ